MGDDRSHGIFDCEGVSVVNGGQTVGVIWEAAKRITAPSQLPNAKVHVRLISLEKCPEDFGRKVTRSTNTQNPIQHRDFAALDPTQHRLAREMELDGKKYAFKSGDLDPKGDQGCNIEDATVALACANSDSALAVQAKREIGQLWRDIEKPPYTTLFNEQLQAREMWRAVQISRAVSGALDALDKTPYVRGELVAVHGNRFILHMVFQDQSLLGYRNPALPISDALDSARNATGRILANLSALVEEKHPKAYLANLFKNTQKCKALATDLIERGKAEASPTGLFEQADSGFRV